MNADSEIVPGLPEARMASLERVPVRTRQASVTLAAWRLAVESGRGPGALVLIEDPPGRAHYRGEGVFLGWAQDRMEAAWRALLPVPEEPHVDPPQLG